MVMNKQKEVAEIIKKYIRLFHLSFASDQAAAEIDQMYKKWFLRILYSTDFTIDFQKFLEQVKQKLEG
jgi:hypothetical protein